MEKFDIICKECGEEAKIRDYPNDHSDGKVIYCPECRTMEEIK